MAIIAKSTEKDFTASRLTPGAHVAKITGIWDLGLQRSEYQGQERIKHSIMICFATDELLEGGKYDGKQKQYFKRYNLNLNKKAPLRALVECFLGREMTKQEELSFDIEQLIGFDLNIVVTQNGKYDNVDTIYPLGKKDTPLVPDKMHEIGETPEWITRVQDKAVKLPVHANDEEVPWE